MERFNQVHDRPTVHEEEGYGFLMEYLEDEEE